MNKVAMILGLCFGGVALIALAFFLYCFIGTATFISQASTAEGVVIGPSNPTPGARYKSEIRFAPASGQTVDFFTDVSSSPPEFQAGQHVRVYYNQSDPLGTAKPDSFLSLWFLSLLSGIFLVVFGAISGGFGLVVFTSWRRRKWLMQNGQRITAHFDHMGVNRNVSNMGRNPYIITAQWTDPNTERAYFFNSESFWEQPRHLSPGDPVEVLVDPKNYARYYVVTEPLKADTGGLVWH